MPTFEPSRNRCKQINFAALRGPSAADISRASYFTIRTSTGEHFAQVAPGIKSRQSKTWGSEWDRECTFTPLPAADKEVNLLASVGRRVSVSHDLGEIACEIACNLMMLFANMRYAH